MGDAFSSRFGARVNLEEIASLGDVVSSRNELTSNLEEFASVGDVVSSRNESSVGAECSRKGAPAGQ